MSKAKTQGTLSPFAFGVGRPILEADVQVVAETLNYVAGESPTCYWDFVAGVHGWGTTGDEVATHRVKLATTSGYVEYYRFKIWIDPDEQEIEVAHECVVTAANTVLVKTTIGSNNVITTHLNANNGSEVTDSILTADTGTGWQTVTIEINHSVGSSSVCSLKSTRGEALAIAAADLPDPGDE